MKKTVFLPLIAAGIALVAVAGSTDVFQSASGSADALPATGNVPVGDDAVLIEVLASRFCPDAHHHGVDCRLQEISGRVIAAGKNAHEFHPGDSVGLCGELTPCGRCTECRQGTPENCSVSGRVCDRNCRRHNGNCRNRILAAKSCLIKFSDRETASGQFARLCSSAVPCPRLRCHTPAPEDTHSPVRGCHSHSRKHHCR